MKRIKDQQTKVTLPRILLNTRHTLEIVLQYVALIAYSLTPRNNKSLSQSFDCWKLLS